MHEQQSEAAAGFRVGDLDVDVGLHRVARNGIELPLPRLSYDLFLTLVHAAPNYVSNKQLLDRVWPGLVVTDKTVSQRIKLLRDALGDSPETPRYIGGLRSRGYRIVVPVERLAPPAAHAPAAGSTVSVEPSQPARPRAPWLAGSLVVAASVAALVIWTSASRDDPSAPPSAAVTEPLPTLAVLPFRQTADGGADAFVGAGIAEAVRERLSSARGFETLSPESSVRSVERAPAGTGPAQQLGARYLLDGDVDRSDDALRVSARLTDAATGVELWAGNFDRRVDDIFDVQETIAAQVSEALRASGVGAQIPRPRPQSTADVDAYLAYLRGRALLGRWTVAAARQAQAEFADAIDRDPEFAAAHASLYEARLLAADRSAGGPSPAAAAKFLGEPPLDAVREQNRHLIDRAIALDPQSGAALLARAIWAAKDSDERERDFVRGMQLDPGNGRGIVAYSEFLDRTGRRSDAERMLERALALDPIAPRPHFRRVMRMFPFDPAAAMAGMAHVLDIDPSYQPALQRYAKYRWMFDGDLAQAIPTIERALALDPGNPWLTHTAVAMYLDIGDVEAARRLVSTARQPAIAGDLLLAVYDRDSAAAGAAAFEDAAYANGLHENWGVYEALRDWALESGQLARALDSLRARTRLSGDHDEVDLDNFRAVPAAAQILLALGRNEEARGLLAATIQWIDDFHLPNFSTIYALRVKASALLLLDERDLAIDTLDASFRSKDYLQWWYTLERDPLWLPLHGDQRFVQIAERVRRHIEDQRTALAAARRQDTVPADAHGTE